MPHTFVILFFIVVIAAVCTWIVPSGEFDYEKATINNVERTLVIPGSFHKIPKQEANPAGLIDVMSSFHKGMISASEVMMLIFIVNGAFSMIIKTGAFHALLGTLLKKLHGKEKIIIPLFFVIFALCASIFGMMNEFNGLIPIFVGLGTALGYDAMVGMAIIVLGIYVGFAASIMNPFTLVIAQTIAGVPIYSNFGFRVVCLVIFCTISIWWIFRYGKKIAKDPTKSLMYGEETKYVFNKEELVEFKMETKHILILFEILVALVVILYGFIKCGWGSIQLSGVFLLMGIVAALINGWNADKIANEFLDGCKNIIYGALIVGVAKAILVVMQEGKIVDTLINYMATGLQSLPSYVAAQGMLLVQTLINFVIPSGSGQAATVIPIMAPIGDLLGVSREVVVLAYQFGDGFSNLLWPTCGVAVVCGLAGVPMNKWWKFYIPLFGILYVVQMIILFVAVAMGL